MVISWQTVTSQFTHKSYVLVRNVLNRVDTISHHHIILTIKREKSKKIHDIQFILITHVKCQLKSRIEIQS